MMAPGFKPVGWVAARRRRGDRLLHAVAERRVRTRRTAQRSSGRSSLPSRRYATLQTELGTRGRLAQLEQWNADVLALSAPTTPQFLDR